MLLCPVSFWLDELSEVSGRDVLSSFFYYWFLFFKIFRNFFGVCARCATLLKSMPLHYFIWVTTIQEVRLQTLPPSPHKVSARAWDCKYSLLSVLFLVRASYRPRGFKRKTADEQSHIWCIKPRRKETGSGRKKKRRRRIKGRILKKPQRTCFV